MDSAESDITSIKTNYATKESVKNDIDDVDSTITEIKTEQNKIKGDISDIKSQYTKTE